VLQPRVRDFGGHGPGAAECVVKLAAHVGDEVGVPVRERFGGAKRVVEHALHVQRRRNGARRQRRNHAQLAARSQGQGSRELLHNDVAGGAQERLAVGAQ